MSRRVLTVVVLVGVVLAGCSGGPSRVVASGSPATVGEGALSAAGYEHTGTTDRRLNATVEATISGDVELNGRRPVTATTPVASYRRGTEAGPAVAAVAAAPAVRPIENQPVVRDPLATLSTPELVTYLQSTYAVERLDRAGDATVPLLGNETAARTYAGTATRGGETVPVTVTVASVRDGDEFVTVAVIEPRSTADRERLRQLLAGVRH